MKKIVIQAGTYYLRFKNNYIVDCIRYNPYKEDYIEYRGEIPADIMCGCYKYKGGKIQPDLAKYNVYLASLPEKEEVTNEDN